MAETVDEKYFIAGKSFSIGFYGHKQKKKDKPKDADEVLNKFAKKRRRHHLVYFETSGTNSTRFFVSFLYKGFLVVKLAIEAIREKFMF